MDKRQFRKKALEIRDALPAEKRKEWSNSIRKRALRYVQENDIAVVAAYASFRSEPETMQMIQELLEIGKKVCLPRCEKNSVMHMVSVRSMDDLTSGAYGIQEPIGNDVVLPEEIDLVLVPGCAFGQDMSRLGYGGGYYDRYLSGCKQAKKVGLCFEASLCPQVPREASDVFMDSIITEKRVMNKV